MKRIFFISLMLSLFLSITFCLEGKDIKNPILRRVITKGYFPNVTAVEELEETPENLEGRYSVIALTDAETRKWLMTEKGAYDVFFLRHKLRVMAEGIPAYEFTIEDGMRTTETYPGDHKNKTERTTYFFSAIDTDDNDKMLLRIAFNTSVLGGRACITLFRVEDLKDWMGFRVR